MIPPHRPMPITSDAEFWITAAALVAGIIAIVIILIS